MPACDPFAGRSSRNEIDGLVKGERFGRGLDVVIFQVAQVSAYLVNAGLPVVGFGLLPEVFCLLEEGSGDPMQSASRFPVALVAGEASQAQGRIGQT